MVNRKDGKYISTKIQIKKVVREERRSVRNESSGGELTGDAGDRKEIGASELVWGKTGKARGQMGQCLNTGAVWTLVFKTLKPWPAFFLHI